MTDSFIWMETESELIYTGHYIDGYGVLEAVDGPGSASTSANKSRLCMLDGAVPDLRLSGTESDNRRTLVADSFIWMETESELIYRGHCVDGYGALEAVDGPGLASTSANRSRLCMLEGAVPDLCLSGMESDIRRT